MKKALAIDVGGTKIYSAIINEKGEIVSEIKKIIHQKLLKKLENFLKLS